MEIKPLDKVDFIELVALRSECESIGYGFSSKIRGGMSKELRVKNQKLVSKYSLLENEISLELKKRVDSYFIEPEK